jgi:LEA14-like dessication related protein
MREMSGRVRAAPNVAGLTVGLAAAVAAACAILRPPSFEQPSVGLDAVEITGLDLDGVTLNLWLDVHNPNDYEIRASRIEAALDLEGTHFGSAALQQVVVLPATSNTLVGVPAEFTWDGVAATVRALTGRGAVNYKLDTKLRVETSFGRRTLRISKEGEVPIRDG